MAQWQHLWLSHRQCRFESRYPQCLLNTVCSIKTFFVTTACCFLPGFFHVCQTVTLRVCWWYFGCLSSPTEEPACAETMPVYVSSDEVFCCSSVEFNKSMPREFSRLKFSLKKYSCFYFILCLGVDVWWPVHCDGKSLEFKLFTTFTSAPLFFMKQQSALWFCFSDVEEQTVISRYELSLCPWKSEMLWNR